MKFYIFPENNLKSEIIGTDFRFQKQNDPETEGQVF